MCDQVRFSWTEDPGDPVVLYAAELATSYWREVLGRRSRSTPQLSWRGISWLHRES